jgi:GNAT superfamily N-acetyltransferase
MSALRRPKSERELAALHDLRDAVLFKGRGRNNYDRHHADDTAPGNHFMGLWRDDLLLGTLRIDFLDSETAVLRLVAIEPRLQRRGIGRAMVEAAERFVLGTGRRLVVTNAAIDAADFYARLGYERKPWHDPGEGAAESIVPMQKYLRPK